MGGTKKGGHGRAQGKRNQPVGGGGSSTRHGIPALRPTLKKDPGLPALEGFSQKMENAMNRQKRKQNLAINAAKKRKGDTGKPVPCNTPDTPRDAKLQMASLVMNAARQQHEFEARQDFLTEGNVLAAGDGGGDLAKNRSRENSRKRFWKEFQKVVSLSDVLLEVLDARDPLGCRLAEIEKAIDSQHNGEKKIVLVLNKVDLVPKENIQRWLEYFRVEGIPVVAFSAAAGGKAAAQETSTSKDNEDPTHRCVHHLFEVLRRFQRTEGGGRKRITVGVIGYPNVGKSSIINALKRQRVVGVGNTPGFTTAAQEVHLQQHVKVVDCPGVVMSESEEAEVVLRNAMKIEQIDDPIRPVELIAERCGPERLQAVYQLPPFTAFDDFVRLLAERKGKLLKGGDPNSEEVCRVVLRDWNGGRIPFYTIPPSDRDFIAAPETLKPTSAEMEGETRILNSVTSTKTDFVCINATKHTPVYGVDDDEIQRKVTLKRSRQNGGAVSDDDSSSSDGDAAYDANGDDYNPFQTFDDDAELKQLAAEIRMMQGKGNTDANENGEGMDEDHDQAGLGRAIGDGNELGAPKEAFAALKRRTLRGGRKIMRVKRKAVRKTPQPEGEVAE